MFLQDFLNTNDGKTVTKLNRESCTYSFFYNYWRDLLFERIMRLFVWDGVDDFFPTKEIETRLHLSGFTVVTNDKKGQLSTFFGTFYGPTKYYDEFTNVTYHSPLESGTRTIGKDCVIINNNSLRNATFSMVHHYSTLLAHNEVTLINSMINARDAGGVPIVTTEKQKQSVTQYLNRLFNGQYGVVADSSTLGVQYAGADRHTAQSIIDLYQTRERILKSFYNDIGVRTAVEKRANVVTPEITANDGLLQLNISDMLHEREQGCERVNQMYGTNWSVRLADELQFNDENLPLNNEENTDVQS